MKIDFYKLMTPEATAECLAEQAEVQRIHGLADRPLAEELLSLARRVRAANPVELSLDSERNRLIYDTSFVWGLIPEIAHRLGARDFLPGERAPEYAALSNEKLREWVEQSLNWLSARWRDERGLRPWRLLSRSAEIGNPAMISLDRIDPPALAWSPDLADDPSAEADAAAPRL